jgi:hypothetical protein
MARPRFLYVMGTVRDGSPYPAWPDRESALRGRPSDDGTWVSWRLAGANNRELGRSAVVHPDVAECRRDAMLAVECAANAQVLLALSNVTGLWVWRLDLDDHPLAIAARGHQRRRECEYSLSRFLETIPAAVVPELHHVPARGRPRGMELRLVNGPGAA